MVSLASAAAIWGRLCGIVRPLEPAVLAVVTDDRLQAVGLSRQKIKTLRALAEAVSQGSLDLDRLGALAEDEQRRQLTAVPGIGPWTADVYVMFAVGTADAWAPGDLALQVAVQELLGLEARPGVRQMQEIGERWRPWRGVAARMLWAYYRHRKGRSGAPLAAAAPKSGDG